MPVHIALLRAVNIGSHGKVAMADLRKLFQGLGYSARTLLQSGNVVFEADEANAKLERRLEAESEKQLGLKTEFMVRSAAEWDRIIAGNPFAKEAKDDPAHLLLLALKDEPDLGAEAALKAAIKGREIVAVRGREAYPIYPDGIGRSKLTAKMIESKLGTRGTGRNWNTVLKLAALAKEMAG